MLKGGINKPTIKVSRMGEIRKAYRTLVGKSKRNRTLGRTRYRWEEHIETNLKETGHGLDSIGSGKRSEARICKHGSMKVGNFMSS
jgi:hypothetical protein